jgi:hypothetical protein
MKEEVTGSFDNQITPDIDPLSRSTPDPDDINAIESLVNEVENEQQSTPEPISNEPDTQKITEPTVEPTTEPAPEPEVASDPVAEKEAEQVQAEPKEEDPLEREFPTPKHLSPEKKSNWANLRQRASTFEKKAKEVENKYEEAVKALASYEKGAALPEPIQKEIEELRQFRRMADIQSDPEFQKEYVQSIISEEDKLFGKFKELGMSDEAITEIIKSGGILSKSRDEWAKLILAPLKGEEYEFVREDIKKALTNIYGIADKRLNVIQDAAKNYDTWQSQKKTQTAEQEKISLSQMQEEVQRIQKEIPWANEPQRPINPTPEQAKNYERQMSEWNTHVERFQKGLYSTDPKIKAQTAMAACGYFKLAEDIKSYQAENAALKAQIQKLQSVGRTNTQPVVNAPKPVSRKPAMDFMMDDQTALEQMINEIEGR